MVPRDSRNISDYVIFSIEQVLKHHATDKDISIID